MGASKLLTNRVIIYLSLYNNDYTALKFVTQLTDAFKNITCQHLRPKLYG